MKRKTGKPADPQPTLRCKELNDLAKALGQLIALDWLKEKRQGNSKTAKIRQSKLRD